MSQRVKSPPAVPGLIAIVAVFALCFGFIGEPTMDSSVTNLAQNHQSIDVATTSIATVVPAITSTLPAVSSQVLTCVSQPFCSTTTAARLYEPPGVFNTAVLTLTMTAALFAVYSVRHNEFLNRATRRLLAKLRVGMHTATLLSKRYLLKGLTYIFPGAGTLTHNVVTWTQLWHSGTMVRHSVVTLVLGSIGAALGSADPNLVLSTATSFMVSALIVNSRLQGFTRSSFIPTIVAGGRDGDFLESAAGQRNPRTALPALQATTIQADYMKINTINVSAASKTNRGLIAQSTANLRAGLDDGTTGLRKIIDLTSTTTKNRGLVTWAKAVLTGINGWNAVETNETKPFENVDFLIDSGEKGYSGAKQQLPANHGEFMASPRDLVDNGTFTAAATYPDSRGQRSQVVPAFDGEVDVWDPGYLQMATMIMVTSRAHQTETWKNYQRTSAHLTGTDTMFDHSVLPQNRRPAHKICLTNRICRLHDVEIARGYLISGIQKPAVAITPRPLDRPTWDAARLVTRELVTA